MLAMLFFSTALILAQSKVVTTKSGLKYADLKVGTGDEAVVGATVDVI
jgi:FKBP-type peptidyl-prolyl cis-trans isomerase